MASAASVSWNETKGEEDRMDESVPGMMNTSHILGQSERIKRFGIECLGPAGDGILFRAGTWKPGGEYVQKLVVRNVSTSVKKLKYKLPTTRYFSLAYPEVVVLSPGMSAELDVIFRPVENDPYDDTIFVTVLGGAGGFHVSVKATIDKLIVKTPFGVDLGFCPTYQTTTKVFRLSNHGEIDAPFKWDQPKGFKLEPSSGIVLAGTQLDICVSVVPTDASVVVAQAVCTVGGPNTHAIIDEPILTTRLSAIGKYAYISLSETEVNFGEVLTGTPAESIKKELILRNDSVVPAEYALVRHEVDADAVFDLTPESGVIPPQSELVITVRYHALGAGSYSLDRYTFITPGDCRVSVTLAGTSLPCKVLLSKEPALTSGAIAADGSVLFSEAAPGDSLNFRDIEIGKSETRVLQLRNTSARDVHFSILTGADGLFKVNPMRGIIKAEGPPFSIAVSFTPGSPINYYKRMYVLLGDTLPQFFDCMGSGFIRAKGDIKEQRPAPLRHAHIQAYRNRAVHGMGGMSPDELDAAHTSGTADPSFFGQIGTTGTRAMSLTTLSNPLTRSGETSRVNISTAHEFFIEDTDLTCREINCNTSSFEFGFIPVRSCSESKTATISNNTNGKVTVVWKVPRTVNDMGEYEQPAFEVSPLTCDINPGQSAPFKIVFKPHQTDRNFVGELEALVFFKNQRTFRLVNDATLTPPWCLTFNVCGHTFSSGQLLATARLTGGNVRGGKLLFPSCFEGETLYQSVILHNTSNLPSTFRFEVGFGEGDMRAMTTLGGSSDSDAFSVRPVQGEVAAESFAVVYIRFTPSKSRKYTQLLRCFVNGDPSTKLLLEGTSAIPFLLCPDVTSDDPTLPTKPAQLIGKDNSTKVRDFLDIPGIIPSPHNIPHGPLGSFYMKPTCVGLSTSRKFTLKNHSRLPLRYRIILPPEADGILSITPLKGLLRGNQITKLTIAFAPQACFKYQLKVKIVVYPIGGRAQRVIDSRQPMGCTVPEILQTVSFLVIAPGEIGAVQFDPPRLEMDVRLVYTAQQQNFYLENVSDSDLSYRLVYREEYVKDTGATHTAASLRDHVVISDVKPLHRGGDVAEGSDDSLTCAIPEGVLQARSRLRAPITFQPTKAGLFDFIIYCEVCIADGSENSIMLPNEEVALLRVSQKDRESNVHGLGVDALSGLPLVACVSTRATFPKINIADVRMEQAGLVTNVEHLWRNYSLRALNTDLSKPLTVAECKMNASSSPDLSKLKKYKFEFTPDVVGAPQQSVTFLFRNNGHLTTNFHLHLPNEKELELEQWCDEDEPSEELNKIICMIEELNLFTIDPPHGTLEPGQSTNVTITYSHKHLKFGGVHNLPIHVKLDKGKQFFLELVGRTLPQATSASITPTGSRALTGGAREKKPLPLTNINALPPTDIMLTACTGSEGKYELISIPVGLDPSETPLQRVQIINVSGCRAIYDLDMASIDNLTDANYGQPILRCANPTGIIEPRSFVFLEWYFYPIEAKTYNIPIKIMYEKHGDSGSAEAMGDFPQNSIYSTESAGIASESVGGGVQIALPVPPRGGKNSAGVKRRKMSSSPEINFTFVAKGYDPREKVLVDNQIFDRPSADRKPFPTIFGEYPPTEQLITFPKQLASLSSDLLSLNFMPQGSKCSRLVVLRNLLAKESVEFSLDVDSCRLVQEGLLSIYPTSGKLEPNEFALIDFNFSLDTRSIALSDSVIFNVYEIIGKTGKTRRGGIPSKLLDRVLKKETRTEHESVVKKITFARNIQLEMNADFVPNGRTSSMPSTINVNGRVESGISHSTTQNVTEVPRSKVGFDASFATGSAVMDGTADMSASHAGNTSKAGSRTSGRNSGTGTSTQSKIGGSGMMSRNRKKEEDNKTLHGSSNSFILRVTGFVLPFETTYKIFKQMGGYGVIKGLSDRDAKPAFLDATGEKELEKPGCMTDFYVPPVTKFIPRITGATFTNGDVNEQPVKSKLANALSKIDSVKEFEVRDISQTIMHDLFRSLLDTASVKEYTENVVNETAARTVTTDDINGASIVVTSTLKLTGALDDAVPSFEGGSLYGVYIDELRHELRLGNVTPSASVDSNADDDEVQGFTADADAAAASASLKQNQNMALAMQQPDFMDLAAEILRNTMYNLMQEAAFKEFPVTEEPLQFAMHLRSSL